MALCFAEGIKAHLISEIASLYTVGTNYVCIWLQLGLLPGNLVSLKAVDASPYLQAWPVPRWHFMLERVPGDSEPFATKLRKLEDLQNSILNFEKPKLL
jgi:hypothetical protein